MDYGSTGGAVSGLQITLNVCYGAHLAVDGGFGSATRKALTSAQAREGITADGLYGSQSKTHLKWTIANEITDVRHCGHRY